MDKRPPKQQRPDNMLQNTEFVQQLWISMDLQQKGNTQSNLSKEERGLVTERGPTPQQQGAVYFPEQKHLQRD